MVIIVYNPFISLTQHNHSMLKLTYACSPRDPEGKIAKTKSAEKWYQARHEEGIKERTQKEHKTSKLNKKYSGK